MSVYINPEMFCEKCKIWYDQDFYNKKCPSCKNEKKNGKKTFSDKVFECIFRRFSLH